MGRFCGLTETGDAICWGFMAPDIPAVTTEGPFTALAPADHVCALRVDGSVDCWGNETYGATEPPAGSFSSLVSSHVVAATAAGTRRSRSAGGNAVSNAACSAAVRPSA